jgi:hypothetical protein
MFIGHTFFGIPEADSPDHFAAVRVSRYNGMFAGFKRRQRLITKQETESALLPDTPVTGDTILIENGFYLGGKIDGFASGADYENQYSHQQNRYDKQHSLHWNIKV